MLIPNNNTAKNARRHAKVLQGSSYVTLTLDNRSHSRLYFSHGNQIREAEGLALGHRNCCQGRLAGQTPCSTFNPRQRARDHINTYVKRSYLESGHLFNW